MKKCYAVVGRNGSGKETLYQITKELFPDKTFSIHHFSDPLNETVDMANDVLKKSGLNDLFPKSRTVLQYFSTKLREIYSQSLLARTMWERASKDSADVVFVDGIRRPVDALMLRRIPGSCLWAVVASPEVRFQRLKSRNRSGASLMTWDQFLLEEEAEPERLIDEVVRSADFTFDNSGTIDHLRLQVRNALG